MYNYEMILSVWILLFIPVYVSRIIITSHATKQIQGKKWSFNTLIIGNGKNAYEFAKKLNEDSLSLGYNVVVYVNIPVESLTRINQD